MNTTKRTPKSRFWLQVTIYSRVMRALDPNHRMVYTSKWFRDFESAELEMFRMIMRYQDPDQREKFAYVAQITDNQGQEVAYQTNDINEI